MWVVIASDKASSRVSRRVFNMWVSAAEYQDEMEQQGFACELNLIEVIL